MSTPKPKTSISRDATQREPHDSCSLPIRPRVFFIDGEDAQRARASRRTPARLCRVLRVRAIVPRAALTGGHLTTKMRKFRVELLLRGTLSQAQRERQPVSLCKLARCVVDFQESTEFHTTRFVHVLPRESPSQRCVPRSPARHMQHPRRKHADPYCTIALRLR